MKPLVRISQVFVVAVGCLFFAQTCVLTKVQPGEVGVRYNNAFGLLEEDMGPGWHWEVMGLQRVWTLPTRFLFLNFAGDAALSIRTKDNNTVTLDVSVPYRIIPDSAHKVMDAGNHLPTEYGYRFERFAHDTTVSVLREHLAALQSQDFYNTDRRLEVASTALKVLNEQLLPLNLEASGVMIRAAYFRPAYEQQLAQIQLNEQQKLLDNAKRVVAEEAQKLDNYTQQTAAMVAAKEQDWARKIAELERAYQVGVFLGTKEGLELAIGSLRTSLAGLDKEKREAKKVEAADVLGIAAEDVSDAHMLGIKNIQAETVNYEKRIRSQADGVRARLAAEGDAKVATVKGKFEAKLNSLLGSPGGRAFVSYKAAENVKFNDRLIFQSQDGIPSVLRLRDFAKAFMGE